MPEEQQPYDLQPDRPEDPGAGLGGSPEGAEATSGLGGDPQRPPRSVREQTCPNCGAPMPGRDTLLCLRCGFDLKSLKVVKTATPREPVEVLPQDEPDEPEAARPIVSRAGRGDQVVPLVLAAVAALALLAGCLAGARGLFPGAEAAAAAAAEAGRVEGVSIDFSDRMAQLGRIAVQVGLLTICGVGALLIVAMLWGAQLGDVRLAIARVAAMALLMRLVAFIDLEGRSAEWTVETIIQIAVALALAAFFFSFKPRDAVLYGLVAVLALLSLWLVGGLATWAL